MLTISKTPKGKALAMIEYTSIANGITALDIVTKTAEVDILSAQAICPGKYMILFSGSLGAVRASLDGLGRVPNQIDQFLLGRPHPDVFAALNAKVSLEGKTALGLIETHSGAASLKAADTAAKTSWITLAEIRISQGMCGKSTVMFTGDLAAVAAALETAKKEAAGNGQLLDTALIPNPDAKMIAALNMSSH